MSDTTKTETKTRTPKTLTNTDVAGAKEAVPDIVVWGNGDAWQLLCKASSKKEGWMKSTKAMTIQSLGVALQVTTQQGERVSEAVTFIPGAVIVEDRDPEGNVVGRHLSHGRAAR